jgi:hypothetical protein
MRTPLKFVECLTCAAVYARVLADGTEYYHACPPLSDDEVIAALELGADRSAWTPEERFAFDTASRLRPDHRDENIALPTRRDDPKQIKAVGLGEPRDRK